MISESTSIDAERLRIFFAELADVPLEEWQLFKGCLKQQVLKPGQHVIKAGESAAIMSFVLKGLLMAYYQNADGREIVRNFTLENQLACAYKSASRAAPSHVSIVALEETVVLTFSYQDLLDAYDRSAVWERVGRKLFEAYCGAFERRTFQLMALDAKSRYEDLSRDYPELIKRVQRQYIATFLGITPQSLSRLMKDTTHLPSIRKP
jgi:CRP-like cAMP-binding protein